MLGQHKILIHIMGVLYHSFYPYFMCSIICWMFHGCVKAHGYKARVVGLNRSKIKEGHSVCEVLINNKWVCFDPSFNVCIYTSASKFNSHLFVFYEPEIKRFRKDEFLDLYSNRIYYDEFNTAGYKES